MSGIFFFKLHFFSNSGNIFQVNINNIDYVKLPQGIFEFGMKNVRTGV